jgi:hypothetical protein
MTRRSKPALRKMALDDRWRLGYGEGICETIHHETINLQGLEISDVTSYRTDYVNGAEEFEFQATSTSKPI